MTSPSTRRPSAAPRGIASPLSSNHRGAPRHADPRVASWRIALLGAASLAACSASSAATDGGRDAGPPCPPAPPAADEACASPGLACVYERCATEGFVSATCARPDGGGARWSRATRACDVGCGGETCRAGQVCMSRASGALITACGEHACGEGPLTCACVCGAGTECGASPSASEGALFTCYVGCGADICP